MINNTQESYVLSEINIEETIVRINDFCKNGFQHTHDWMDFPDKISKNFDELTFEKSYQSYLYNAGTEWVIAENLNNDSIIYIDSSQYEYLQHKILLGSKLIFTENAIYYIEKNREWQKYVGKIYT
ncbi:hypothetical protein [Bacillus sp. FJAT-22090]|uniref:hypothetical protein n=1 Tax=Bacillus sp. FJAT-22090 TaxID=1581038 RepID=UPI0011A70852|nr:hypothetical protein [Bacillus sp. FJAT-22090]